MARRGFRPEQIIKKLGEAEVLFSQGSTIGEAARRIGITEQTYYRWRREYGGMRIEQFKRLKELKKENTRLKRLAADISLDIAIRIEFLVLGRTVACQDYGNIDRNKKNELRKTSLANHRFLPPRDISQIKYTFNLKYGTTIRGKTYQAN